MRNIINRSFALASLAAFAAETETGSTGPVPAENAVIDVKPIAAANEAAAAERKAKAERLAAKRKAASAKPTSTKPGKRAAKAKPAAEAAKPDARAVKAERIAADRKAVSSLYAAFEANRESIPVKPLSAFKPETTTAHPIARKPSARQAAAIALAFSASGKKLATGATATRVFELNGSRVCIENGVLRDAVSSGLITVSGDSPETELLKLACKPAVILGHIGEKRAKLAKLI